MIAYILIWLSVGGLTVYWMFKNNDEDITVEDLLIGLVVIIFGIASLIIITCCWYGDNKYKVVFKKRKES